MHHGRRKCSPYSLWFGGQALGGKIARLRFHGDLTVGMSMLTYLERARLQVLGESLHEYAPPLRPYRSSMRRALWRT